MMAYYIRRYYKKIMITYYMKIYDKIPYEAMRYDRTSTIFNCVARYDNIIRYETMRHDIIRCYMISYNII